MRVTHTHTEKEAETQAEGETGSMQGARLGTPSPGTQGSGPGLKAGAKPLSHPGIPLLFKEIHKI